MVINNIYFIGFELYTVEPQLGESIFGKKSSFQDTTGLGIIHDKNFTDKFSYSQQIAIAVPLKFFVVLYYIHCTFIPASHNNLQTLILSSIKFF